MACEPFVNVELIEILGVLKFYSSTSNKELGLMLIRYIGLVWHNLVCIAGAVLPQKFSVIQHRWLKWSKKVHSYISIAGKMPSTGTALNRQKNCNCRAKIIKIYKFFCNWVHLSWRLQLFCKSIAFLFAIIISNSCVNGPF